MKRGRDDAAPPSAAGAKLVNRNRALESACESLPIGFFECDREGRWLHWNKECSLILGLSSNGGDNTDVKLSADTADEAPWLVNVHPSDRDRLIYSWQSFLKGDADLRASFRVRKRNDSWIWAQLDARFRETEDQREFAIVGTIVPTPALQEHEPYLTLESELLEEIARGLPLKEALTRLALFIERQSPDVIASILLIDSDGSRLWQGAAPSLDPDYSNAIDGLPLGEGVGSCGTAAYRGEPVFVADVQTDPLWEVARPIADRFGLRACWSTPVKDRNGAVLGTFAIYRLIPGAPSAHHLRIMEMATHLASIVLARHRDEQKLLQSEQRFRRMFEQAAIGVAQVDSVSGTILRANRRYGEILGVSPEQLTGEKWLDLIQPDDASATTNRMERLLAGEISEFALEQRLRRSDGSFVWVNMTVSGMWREGAKPTAHSAIIEDITKRKQAEEALRLSEERFRNLVQTAPFGVLRSDLDGRITFANATLGTIYRCSAGDMVGTSIWDLAVDPDSRELMKSQMRSIDARSNSKRPAKVTTGFFCKHATRDARPIDVHLDGTHERNRDGEDTGWIVVVTDVTTRLEFERRLEFQADVLNRVSDAVVVTDDRGSVTYANEAAKRMLGILAKHRDGQESLPLHQQLIADGPLQIEVMRSLDSFGQWQGEHEVEIDGETRTVEVKLREFDSPDSDAHYMLFVVRDISMRTQAELERRQHRDALAHMTRLGTMGELVAGIAHEVKQPLYAITNFATATSISLRNVEPGVETEADWLSDLNEFNDGVRRASQRANEIIERLREFSRKGEQTRSRIDLNEVVRDSIDLVAFEARQCDAVVETDLQDLLPQVNADRIQCEQVVVNLLHNAYEALAKVEPQRRVVVRSRQIGDQVEIEVNDNGSGIEASQEARIFEAFCTTKPSGMGMGLAISRTIVEDHGGRLSVEPSSSGGATFTFALPVAGPQNSAAE